MSSALRNCADTITQKAKNSQPHFSTSEDPQLKSDQRFGKNTPNYTQKPSFSPLSASEPELQTSKNY